MYILPRGKRGVEVVCLVLSRYVYGGPKADGYVISHVLVHVFMSQVPHCPYHHVAPKA